MSADPKQSATVHSSYFGGDQEDHDCVGLLHPPGCRHAPGRIAIRDCPETCCTVVVGGMLAIEKAIEELEQCVDRSDPTLHPGAMGMNNAQNSICLYCEICNKHSVVSWECYNKNIRRGESSHKPCYIPLRKPGEYYMFVAMNRDIYITPNFCQSNNVILEHSVNSQHSVQALPKQKVCCASACGEVAVEHCSQSASGELAKMRNKKIAKSLYPSPTWSSSLNQRSLKQRPYSAVLSLQRSVAVCGDLI